MVINTILSDFQQHALSEFKRSTLNKHFYLAGGTALAEYYLHHRKSEDLDFFTQEELSLPSLRRFASHLGSTIALDKVEYQHGFGLYTFFFYPRGEVAKYKLDFGQYPFGTIEPLKTFDKLQVESLYDLAVDKTHTISIRPRARDFIDLYFILQQQRSWKFRDLLKAGQQKFELYVDPLQLGENLFQVKELRDLPIMLKPLDLDLVQQYFLKEAKKLKAEVF